ncbi:hypothetical protein D3C72_1522780 [compost metagenome]
MGNAARHIHAQTSLRAIAGTLQARFGIGDQIEDFAAAVEVALAFRCQAEVSGGTVQQARLQMFFQPLDDGGHRRCGQSQGLRRAHETSALDHAKEYLHCLYAVHVLSS